MSRTFYIGCTHFGHASIIEKAGRPFKDLGTMNEEMTRRWNDTVGKNDTVYHLGDFAYKTNSHEIYKSRLNGNIIWVQGNHDPEYWGEPYLEIRDHGTRICLMHYPIEEWNGWYKGAYHIHAHTHKPEILSAERRFNVCADAIDFTPRTFAELKEMAERGK